jgi:hypothetical protein
MKAAPKGAASVWGMPSLNAGMPSLHPLCGAIQFDGSPQMDAGVRLRTESG